MTVHFAETEIKGSHGRVIWEEPKTQVWRFHVFGAIGEVEVRGGFLGRAGYIDIILHDQYKDRKAIEAAIEKLRFKYNEHGTLKAEDVDDDTEYEEVTFVGFEYVALNNQDFAGPFKDVAETVDPWDGKTPRTYSKFTARWICHGKLHFYQPRPKMEE